MSIQKEYSVEYMKRFAQQIEQLSVFVSQYSATLLLLVNNKLSAQGK
jgi:hypothetical protein